MARLLLFIACLFLFLPSYAQEKCAIVSYQKHLESMGKRPEPAADFEKWMQQKKALRVPTPSPMRAAGFPQDSKNKVAAAAKWVIPVVVHIIHQGEKLGEGSNIPDEQVHSQIRILNEDFRALNQNQINNLPAAFKAVAADTEIEFVLAKQDPEGLATNGILRVASSKADWSQTEDLSLKQLSHWPAAKYLNMYVANLGASVIGWAQFPTSDQLQGLGFSDVAEETDGVVIDYEYFGTGFNAIPSSLGRTATHEVGHYFGLRHIWGDGDCSVDDYVSDTPLDDKSNTGCPTSSLPKSCDKDSNGNFLDAMYQNYLDYSDDDCMALFTLGQKQRMEVVLQHSPRRKDLHYSSGKEEPVLVANDAGLRSITLTPAQLCDGGYLPTIEVRNYGNNQLTQLRVTLALNGSVVDEYSFSTQLAYLETQQFPLNEIRLSPGTQQLSATISSTNGTTDGNNRNNTATADQLVPQKAQLPVAGNFESGFSPFSVLNPDGSFTWSLASAPNSVTPNNKAALLNFYDYESTGQRDVLASPVMDLSNESNLYMSLRIAHARYDRSTLDGLEIYVSTDCRSDYRTAVLVYEAYGEALATAPSVTTPFAPADGSQWRSMAIDLSAFAGQRSVQVLVVGVNNWGNNLYIDDVLLTNNYAVPVNVALREVLEPSPVIGSSTSPLKVKISNLGSEAVNTLQVKVSLNGTAVKNLSLTNMDLQPLTDKVFDLGELLELGEGPHLLQVQAYSPNGGFDGISADNTLNMQLVVNSNKRSMPIRESFAVQTFNEKTWTSANPTQHDIGWISAPVLGHQGQKATDNYAALAQFEASTGSSTKWLVSPSFNIAELDETGLQFWYYAGGSSLVSLKVLVSADGGISWPLVLWEKNNQQLKEGNSSAALVPASASLWRKEFLGLSQVLAQTGFTDIRIAMVATGEGGSSVYVDDIEFFLSDQAFTYAYPSENNLSIFPNPARDEVHVLFNMKDPEGEEVALELMSNQGTTIYKTSFPNTLNQNYTISLPNIPAGIYYIRIRSASLNTVRKLIVTK